jgi:hypothetical protein
MAILLGVARPVAPAWEPDMGWRVLDPDCRVVDAGGKTLLKATFEFTQEFAAYCGGVDGNRVPLLGGGQ